MSTFFELPHIFVVFPPGAGGNFISGILTRLLRNELNDLALSSTGNAHANSTSKLNFSDIISCGLRWDVPKFNNAEEKLQYYQTEIEKKHEADRDVQVSWSHDFSNIPLYKILFPNCKILVLTHDSDREKLTALVQQELKNRLDPNGFVFLEKDYYLEHWRSSLYRFLINMLGASNTSIALEIANNFKDAKYKPLVTFSAIRMMLRSYGLEHLVDNDRTMKINYFDNCIKPRITEDPSYVYKEGDFTFFIIGPSFKDCITDDCVVLPFNVIMDKNTQELIDVIERLLGDLNSEQLDFIKRNLDNYHSKQAPMLMEDPTGYYSNLAKLAKDQIKSLTTT
jgi:hypothetical protein